MLGRTNVTTIKNSRFLNWENVTINSFEGAYIRSIANVNNVIIAGGANGKIARSTDNGLTWGDLIASPFGVSAVISIANINGVAIAVANGGKS
jgi:hypothetical protein